MEKYDENLSIVILNYLNWEDTVECVESLKKQNKNDFRIIIVDNASSNNSYEELRDRYETDEKIHLLKAPRNLGYAKGNNLGIKFSLKKLNIYNVLIINNDTIFDDINYIEYLSTIKIDSHIGAIGTKIIGKDGKNQNPVRVSINMNQIIKMIFAFSTSLLGFNLTKYKRRKRVQKRLEYRNIYQNLIKHDYILHGAAIFLTENYLRRANGFYPGTFLYMEENILAIIMQKMDLRMKYIDDIHIFHKEDQSSVLSFNNDNKIQLKYKLSSAIHALKVHLSSTDNIIKVINES